MAGCHARHPHAAVQLQRVKHVGAAEGAVHHPGGAWAVVVVEDVVRADHHVHPVAGGGAVGQVAGEHAQAGFHPAFGGHGAGDEAAAADEIGHEAGARPVVDAVGRIPLRQPAGVHHADPVGDGEGFVLVVGDEQGGDALFQQDGAHVAADLLAQLRVQRREGFVQQQQARLGRQCPGQGHALLLAAGELVGVAAAHAGQAHQVEQLLDPGAALVRRPAVQAEADVGGHVQVREQGDVLEHHAHPALLGGHQQPVAGDGVAVQGDAAAVRGQEAGHQAQQGGLAAAGGADQAADQALVQGEGDVFQHRLAVEPHVQVVNGQHGGLS